MYKVLLSAPKGELWLQYYFGAYFCEDCVLRKKMCKCIGVWSKAVCEGKGIAKLSLILQAFLHVSDVAVVPLSREGSLVLQLWACAGTRMEHELQNLVELYCALNFLKMCTLPSGSKTTKASSEDLMYFMRINSNTDFQILLFCLKCHLWLLHILNQNLDSLLAPNKQNSW